MPDSDKILEVLIKLGVVGQQDVQTATDLLKDSVTATLAGGEATRDLGKNTEDAAQSVKRFTDYGEEFNQLIGELNGITPRLGLALKAAFNPETMSATGVVSVLGQLVGLLKQLQEAAQGHVTDNPPDPAARHNGSIPNAETSDGRGQNMDGTVAQAGQTTAAPAAPANQRAAYDELVDRTENHISDLNRPYESSGINGAQARDLADSIDALARAAREHSDRKVEAFIEQVKQMLKSRQSTNGI